MVTIRNQKLFEELKMADDEWAALFNWDGNIKDDRIPIFLGGLDHIEICPKGIYFYDIGMNYKTNNFVIRPE